MEKAYIVGVGGTRFGRHDGHTALDLMASAAESAFVDSSAQLSQ